MANYNLNQFRNTYILNDQSGSLFDSGGPTGSYSSGQNYYVLIAPQYATGTLTLNVVSGAIDPSDALRIYNGIPNTSSYSGLTIDGTLLAVLSGTLTPQTITASLGTAYIRFGSRTSTNTIGTLGGFQLDWTGSGTYTVNSSSGITKNSYAATFPLESYLTFAPGRFTGSSTLTGSKDIVLGFWARYDNDVTDPLRGLITIGDAGAGNQGLVVNKVSTTNDLRIVYRDSNSNANLFTATNMLQGGGTGAPSAAKLVPQWHHYGWAIRRTSTTGYNVAAYRDGVFFASSSATFASVHGNITSSQNLILGQYRTAGVISTGQSWTGSFDDVFLGTLDAATPANHASFFASIYNSGNWSDPTEKITGSYYSGKNGAVVFNWRFEETGSMLNTRDWGSYGNIHSASTMVTGGGNVFLTATSSGQSYTPYGSLVYSASAAVGAASFTSASYTTTETSNLFTVYVDRVSGSAGALTSSCFFYNITAVEGVNYTDSSTQLTWADGETTQKSISIPILYDGVQTSTLSFGIYQVGSDYTTYNLAISTASVNIQDRNRGVFNWQVTSLSAYETGSVANVNITRVSGTYGNVTVQIQKSSSFGGGYASTASAYFLEGDSSKQYSISITDDFIDEPDEIVTFKMTPIDEDIGVYPLTGSNGFLALTIVDNETGSVTFSSSSAAIYENTASYYVGVERIYGGDQAETASITFVGSTYAVSGSDYNIIYAGVTKSSPFNITWADQDKTTKYITASIINDTILESNETITFGIASSSISTIGPSSSFVLTIYDYENTGSVRFATNLYSVSVGSTVNVQVERYIGADVTASAIIDVSSSSTAVAGVDYTNIFPYTVNWADQESGYKNIPIQTISSWESSKTLNLKFTSLTNLSSGSILSSSVSLVSVVYSQSAQTVPLVSSDFTINDYTSLSSQYTRRVENVPYKFVVRGPATIRGSRYKTSGE
jgi:hypothetical protein